MIYFVRRSFEADKNKLIHKKQLKSAVDCILKDAFTEMGIDYSRQQLCFNSYGKPYLDKHPDIFFNISHCEGLAVCTIANSEAGIDAENIREWRPKVAQRVFTQKELHALENSDNKDEFFFRIWTLKESFVKALGIGISYPMKTCEFLFENDRIYANGCDGYSFSQVVLNDEFICSLCINDSDRCSNRLYRICKEDDFFTFDL
ncbi:MAG: 4'-phosphopantetheinyl transferase superfamily protein [Oscillospiraceae bacterium]|nr:4'-phosphopantetheinyl transferase superfamily protein [Oscillospiraceae bacterium]